VSKNIGEWYQKTNKTEDTNKLTLLAFKMIAILHKTLLKALINGICVKARTFTGLQNPFWNRF
jgi:hypothetical protein